MLRWLALCVLLGVAGCGGGSTALPGSVPATAPDLSPDPVALTSDAPAMTFVMQNDSAGASYTAHADPACVSSTGGIYVAGDGQALTAVAGVPTMFLAFAVGSTPPASCSISVTDVLGHTGSVGVTYETVTVQSTTHRAPFALTKGIAAPAAVTITSAGDAIPVNVSGFSGTTTISAGSCAKAGGIWVAPATLANGAGTFVIAPFGIGAISRSCTVTIADSAGGSSTIPVTVSVPALGKFTASAGALQFGCVGTDAPLHCRTLQTATLSETGATAFSIAPRAFPNTTCAVRFEGPLKMVSGTADPAPTAAGPQATVAFDGLLLNKPIGCTRIPITDGGNPAQIISLSVEPILAKEPPPALLAASAPPCTGTDPHVAVPAAPHGMYVWAPNARDTFLLKKYTFGGDHTLCGASLVVDWIDLEPAKSNFDFSSVETAAEPFTTAGLTVNLLFEDTTEGSTSETPSWVFDEVPSATCGGATIPVYWNATYESDWSDFIAHAVAYFTNTSKIRAQVGYLRFATGGGAEALPPPGYNDPTTCKSVWQGLGYSSDVWLTHEINIVNAMASAQSMAASGGSPPHQLIASIPYVDGGKTIYSIPNAFAAVAASRGIGLSSENFGTHGVAAPGSTPAGCNTGVMIIDLHWCQAYTQYAGVVPLAMQTIRASNNPATVPPIDITNMLPYALDNNVQIFELYADEWLEADSGPEWQPFVAADQAKYQAALQSASLVLGATNGK